MPIYTREYMQGLQEEEKKRQAAEAAANKKRMLEQVGATIIGQALNIAKQGIHKSSSYSYRRMSCAHVLPIDDMLD